MKWYPSIWLVAVGLWALPVEAIAADYPLADAKLVIKAISPGRERIVFESRDATLPFPARGGVDDPSLGGAVIELWSLDTGPVPFEAESGRTGRRWRVGAGGYRYRKLVGPFGPAVVRRIRLQEGKRLRFVLHSSAPELAFPVAAVGVRVTMGSLRYCARLDPDAVIRNGARKYRAQAADGATLDDCSDATVGPGIMCGDGGCEIGESPASCPQDCPTISSIVLPVAIEASALGAFVSSQDCTDLAVHGPGDGWDRWQFVSLTGEPESATTMATRFPSECCSTQGCGGGSSPTPVELGSEIGLLNGQSLTLLWLLEGCLAATPPVDDVVVPVLGGDVGANVRPVVAFAPIRILDVQSSGAHKGVTYQVHCGDGMCGLGFCAPGATCETCARDCGECGLPGSASAADAGPRRR